MRCKDCGTHVCPRCYPCEQCQKPYMTAERKLEQRVEELYSPDETIPTRDLFAENIEFPRFEERMKEMCNVPKFVERNKEINEYYDPKFTVPPIIWPDERDVRLVVLKVKDAAR